MMRKTVIALLAGVALGLALPQIVVTTAAQEQEDEDSARTTYEFLDLFGDIFERVRVAYVEDVDEKKLIESAINGMLTSLDPHSAYLPPESYEDMQEQTKGEFGGLGIEVTLENGFVKVVAPIDGTPAAEAGLEAGDFITHLDGESVLGMTLSEAVDKMRGPVGSEIIITVSREGAEEPFDVTIVRDIIQIQAVRGRIEGDVGVLRITAFNEQTEQNLTGEIERLRQEIGPDSVRGFVIDLRNNPGGLLTEAVATADAFLDEGEIVSTRGRNLEQAERFNAKPGDLIEGKPLVVLINQGSASASEIVAGALQDQRRAVLVGAKTFGKGSVQTVMRLGGDRGALKLTTARYYTPSGRSIQALGIEPDILVEQREIATEEEDQRGPRSEAELRGSLEADLTEEEQRLLEEERARHEAIAKLRREDFQLAYALDLLTGLALYDRVTR